jgi:hypothetical protein
MLPAIRALRDELVALEAEDAAKAARETGRAKPRLAATGTAHSVRDVVHAGGSVAMKNPSVPSRSGRVSLIAHS